MYASTSYHASWAYSTENDNDVDHYSSQSLASDSDDSEQELRDLEELLYSHVHYEPNNLCKSGTSDDLSSSDVLITQLSDGALDGLDDIPQSASDTRNSADCEIIVIDAQLPQHEVSRNTTVTANLLSEQLKRKASSCKASDSAADISTKSKNLNATGSASTVVLGFTAAKNKRTLNLQDNGAGTGILDGDKQEVCQPDGQHVARKKLKVKRKSGTSHAVDNAKPIVVDSGSESTSSSDEFCCDLSSEELRSDGADDIQLSNIDVDLPQSSDADALTELLHSLPGMLFCQ